MWNFRCISFQIKSSKETKTFPKCLTLQRFTYHALPAQNATLQRELILLVPPERHTILILYQPARADFVSGKIHLPRLWRSQDSLRADVWLLILPPRKRQKGTKRALAPVLLSQDHGEAGSEQEGHVINLKLWMPCRGGNRAYESLQQQLIFTPLLVGQRCGLWALELAANPMVQYG